MEEWGITASLGATEARENGSSPIGTQLFINIFDLIPSYQMK